MIAQPTFRVFLCAVFVLVVAESDLRAQRGHHHTNPPYVNWNYRTPFGYQFYSGNPYRYLYGYPSSYAYIASPSRFDVRTYYGSPASYSGYPYFYSVSPSGLGSNYRYFIGNPSSYPTSYAFYRTPAGYQYRVFYGNPNSYLYGIPYSYSFARSPLASNYQYFLGNPNSYPISYVSYRTPYGYESRAIYGNPGYVNPYIPWIPTVGVAPGGVAPFPDSGNVGGMVPRNYTPQAGDGAATTLGQLNWPLGLRILPGAAPLRKRIDDLYEAATSQTMIGSIPLNLPQEMKQAVQQLQQLLARDRNDRLSLTATMYEESEQFLRGLQEYSVQKGPGKK